MKKGKNEKNKGKMLIFLLLLIIIIAIVLFLLFSCNKNYTVTFDSDGGSLIANLVIKNGEIINLPDKPNKEGYIFAGWVNSNNEIMTNGSKITEDIALKAMWILNDSKTYTLEFDTDGGNEIGNIIIGDGKIIMLPIAPVRKGYTFIGWINEDGKLITKNMTVKNNIKLKALWIENGSDAKTITFDTDGGSNIPSIKLINGKIILPVNPTKEGFVFDKWVDSNGNEITSESVITDNITIKAVWKNPYTCPSNCTPIGDGSKCTRELTKNMITISSCPSGYTNKNGTCVDVKNSIPATDSEYCKDGSTPVNNACPSMKKTASSAYECAGNEYFDGSYCIPNATYTWVCPSGYYKYTHIEGMGAVDMCGKTASKISSKGCPNGYTKSGDICKKTETVKCKAN